MKDVDISWIKNKDEALKKYVQYDQSTAKVGFLIFYCLFFLFMLLTTHAILLDFAKYIPVAFIILIMFWFGCVGLYMLESMYNIVKKKRFATDYYRLNKKPKKSNKFTLI